MRIDLIGRICAIATAGLVAIGTVTISSSRLVAEPPPPDKFAKPSTYAPVGDVEAQLSDLLGRIETDLSSREGYGEDQIGRVSRDANTIAVLALVLGMHDQQSKLKAAAPALIEASIALADSVDDYGEAQAALAELTKALTATSGNKLDWQPVGDIQQLMLQVPIVNNSLRRGVTGRRFFRSANKNAGYATTLAAIAQASMLDTNYCSDEEDEAKWVAICVDMRSAASDVNVAVRRNDQTTAKAALARLVKTCDACHHDFRD